MVNRRAFSFDLAKQIGLECDRFPETQAEGEAALAALASELEKLSLVEQEQAIFDIHGLSQEKEEDPEAIEAAFIQLEAEIEKIESKDAYERAKFLNEAFVTSRDFRLKFIRSEKYDIHVAAQTIVYHFDLKRRLFGDGELLARPVRQSDLTPKEIQLMKCGGYQFLPERDASGRIVQVVSFDILPGQVAGDKKSSQRALWYIMMCAAEEEDMQKVGSAWIVYHYQGTRLDFDSFRAFNEVETAAPFVCLGCHYCYRNEKLRPFAAGFQLFCNRFERNRVRQRFGSHEDITFYLQTFGMPIEVCPCRPDGVMDNTNHLRWLEGLRAHEEAEASSPNPRGKTIIPKNVDVLFGKNAQSRDHPGNIRAHILVEENFEEYEEAGKVEKTLIADRIIKSIQDQGGKFLKQGDHGRWSEVGRTAALQKIAHWMRHERHKRNNKEKQGRGRTMEATPVAERNVKRVSPYASPLPQEPPADIDQLWEDDVSMDELIANIMRAEKWLTTGPIA